jgi:DNA-binding NarL/FixJ family response regulator
VWKALNDIHWTRLLPRARIPTVAVSSPEGQIRVLLVDDDEDFLASLAELVERQPELSVVGAVSDGIAALDLVDREKPDAVVIDLHMPLLDGVSTVARLRHDRPSLCLIAITGDDAAELRRAAKDAGADDVLLKQELLDALVSRLRESIAAGTHAT